MTIKQIKKHLNIDITKKDRSELYIYLKNIYINQDFEKNNNYSKLARDLKLSSHASVMNNIKKTNTYKSDPLYDIVKMAYLKRNKKYIDEYLKKYKLRKLSQSREWSQRAYLKANTVDKDEFKQVVLIKRERFVRPSILEVAKNLRNVNTTLNNKNYNLWNDEDFKKYYKLIKK